MNRLRLAALLLASLAPAASAQVNVTFRFLPDLGQTAVSPLVRAFIPGTFNNFGPNADGVIQPGAASQATFVASVNEYRKTVALQPGTADYKIHYHQNNNASANPPYGGTWIVDPLAQSACTFGQFNSDCRVTVADPMVFQVAREQEGSGQVRVVSAGVFGTAPVASVTFTVNGTAYPASQTEATGSGIYQLRLPSPVAPGAQVRVDAVMEGGATASAEVGLVPPTVTDRAVPAGLEDGINYDPADDTRAWLVLRAPGKQFVYALGGFNGWTVDDDALMFRDNTDPLGTRWWIELTGLTPGAEVPFYYFVDGLIRVADPYTTKVYFPGEAGYPAGAQQHSVGVLTPGAADFPWTDQSFQAPPQEELVVYELLVRDFLREHSFTALTDTLDYLDRLGVNAIELMPVSEYDGDESWGYNPAFHLALDKYYGTPDEFKAFVDAAHARGIAVLLDVVYNHATGQSPLIRLDNQGDFGNPNPTNPWANPSAKHPFNVFNDLNHESKLTQLWLDKANRFWMEEYHVDGYRYDLSKGFTQTCGGGPCTDANFSTYNPARIAILKRMADQLWAEHSDAVVILEHFANADEERELAAYGRDRGYRGMTLWGNVNNAYTQSAMGYASDSGLERAYPPNSNYPLHGQIAYMESHDEQWALLKVREFGNVSGSYDTRQLATALDRKALATAFFLTVPGPKMLWQFGEVGYGGGPGECLKPGSDGNGDCKQSDPGRVGNKPIRWDYWSAEAAPFANGLNLSLTKASDAERQDRQDLYMVTARLLQLRGNYPLFRSAQTEVTSQLGASTLARWIKLSLPSAIAGAVSRAVIVGNFDVTQQTVAPGFPSTGTWYDAFSGAELEVTDTGVGLSLAPGEYRVYTNVRTENNPVSTTSPVERDAEGLVSVFPNPSASRATVTLQVAAPRRAVVEVFDALGRRVATLADREFGAGEHDLAFDTDALPSGVYFVRWGGSAIPITVTR